MAGEDKETIRFPADVVRNELAVYLGPFTARTAVRTFSKKALGSEPDSVTKEQIPQLLDALGPALRTLLGKASAERVVEHLRKELRP